MNSHYTRRHFLSQSTQGLSGVALAYLLGAARARGATTWPSFTPKAKRVLHIFCPGGLSAMDSFDHKPELEKRDGQPLPGEENFVSFQGKNGPLMRSPWGFSPRGQSGKMISDMLPALGTHADDIAFLHGMTSRSNTHGPGCVFMNTGLRDGGLPQRRRVDLLRARQRERKPAGLRGDPRYPRRAAEWQGELGRRFSARAAPGHRAERRPADPQSRAPGDHLERRRRGHPRPARGARTPATPRGTPARTSSPRASPPTSWRRGCSSPHPRRPISRASRPKPTNSTAPRDANPLKAGYARNCLLSRRLLERGVRYVSLYCASRASGVDGLLNWDAHKTLKADYERHMPILDTPTAALLTDLKQRGLLADTLVLFTTEFGRMPTRQNGTAGRDHNPDGFTCWMMGAGIKGGTSFGATDEFGRRAVSDITTVHDFYATVLHLLGIEHTKLTYYNNGIDRRLTDVHGRVIQEVLA